MSDILTRQGALNFTATVDRVASTVQERHALLGIPEDVALDFAKRCDLISDATELTAAHNFPLQAAEVDTTPAEDADPEVSGVDETSGGDTDEDAESDDQNKPESYYEGKQADDDLLRRLLAEERMGGEADMTPAEDADPEVSGVDEESGGDTDEDPESDDQNRPESYYEGKQAEERRAAPEFQQPPQDETGESVEPAGTATPNWDPNAIADDRGGPYLFEGDEAWMAPEFSQVEFHQLRDKQQAGQLPAVDAKLAAVSEGNVESLRHLAAALRMMAAAPSQYESISRMPGLSPKQMRDTIDRVTRARQQIEQITAQYEDVLGQLKDLETEEKEGIKTLKKAAAQMREKGRYLAEAETALLQFTAYITNKVPGIDQMIARGVEYKGEKAGDFFGRIASELGDEVAEAVEMIYEATKDDLTHTTMAVRGLKVVEKTASFDDGQLKTAGIIDTVVSLKEWLAGKTDALAQKILGFAGDISKWVKGFVERTKIVKKQTGNLLDALSGARKAIDGALEGAGKLASDADNDWGFNLTE